MGDASVSHSPLLDERGLKEASNSYENDLFQKTSTCQELAMVESGEPIDLVNDETNVLVKQLSTPSQEVEIPRPLSEHLDEYGSCLDLEAIRGRISETKESAESTSPAKTEDAVKED